MEKPRFSCSIDRRTVDQVEATLLSSRTHGADLRFHGVVRDTEDGRVITGIDYSHYEGMALRELETICSKGVDADPGHLVFVHHVVGFVPAGEASILIRVQTKHSAEGFELSRNYLAAIKKSVPIWKRPIFRDDASTR